VVRSLIHASTLWEEKHPTANLAEFITYITRLGTYGTSVSVAELGAHAGIRVMTLHKSKGLEYQHVWIGHMNEEVLMSEKHTVFTLPESIKEKVQERDMLTAKRELYVALTRAKEHCTISYATMRNDGGPMILAEIIADLDKKHLVHTDSVHNQELLLAHDPHVYAMKGALGPQGELLPDIAQFVRERFAETKISVSMLNNFFECPWKWYFRNFLRLPETKSTSLALGSAVHSTIEYVLKASVLPSAQDLKQFIHTALIHEGVHDEKECVRLGKDAFSAVKYWIDSYYDTLAKDRISERSVTYRDPQFPNLLMYGKIDLTERDGDRIVVTDFKTGSSKTTGMIEKIDDEGRLSTYMRQLAMYSYLIRGAEEKNVTTSRLLFLEAGEKDKNALYSTHVGSESIDLLIRDIADYQKSLETGTWTDRECNATSYGGSVCEYCARMERIIGGK
jgi:DNA helicase II / ATP-dependent DNA helicase PcrA